MASKLFMIQRKYKLKAMSAKWKKLISLSELIYVPTLLKNVAIE